MNEQAAYCFSRCLALDPEDDETLCALADVYMNSNEFKKASN